MNNQPSAIREHETLLAKVKAGLPRRRAAERRFRAYGIAAIVLGLLVLGVLLLDIAFKGYKAFLQTEIALDVFIDPAIAHAGEGPDTERLQSADYAAMIRQSLAKAFPEVTERGKKRSLSALLSSAAPYDLRDRVVADPGLVGQTIPVWFTAGADVDMFE